MSFRIKIDGKVFTECLTKYIRNEMGISDFARAVGLSIGNLKYRLRMLEQKGELRDGFKQEGDVVSLF